MTIAPCQLNREGYTREAASIEHDADLHLKLVQPDTDMPNWLVRIAALRDPAIKLILPELGQFKNATNEKATRLLGWKPRAPAMRERWRAFTCSELRT